MAGASGHFRITSEALSLEALLARVADPEHGAVVGFLGVVRANSGDRPVAGLEYTAYEEMALAKLEVIGQELQSRFGPLRIAAEHRTGRLPVGTASLALAISAPHRKQAFQAAAYFVDRLKVIVPIWKRDLASPGEP